MTLIGHRQVDQARNEQGVGESIPGPFHMTVQTLYYYTRPAQSVGFPLPV